MFQLYGKPRSCVRYWNTKATDSPWLVGEYFVKTYDCYLGMLEGMPYVQGHFVNRNNYNAIFYSLMVVQSMKILSRVSQLQRALAS
jgi:hypothetical protein